MQEQRRYSLKKTAMSNETSKAQFVKKIINIIIYLMQFF